MAVTFAVIFFLMAAFAFYLAVDMIRDGWNGAGITIWEAIPFAAFEVSAGCLLIRIGLYVLNHI